MPTLQQLYHVQKRLYADLNEHFSTKKLAIEDFIDQYLRAALNAAIIENDFPLTPYYLEEIDLQIDSGEYGCSYFIYEMTNNTYTLMFPSLGNFLLKLPLTVDGYHECVVSFRSRIQDYLDSGCESLSDMPYMEYEL